MGTKIKVDFKGGESRRGTYAVNYMLAEVGDVELYSEVKVPYEVCDEDGNCKDGDDECYGYEELKEDIADQAKKENIDPQALEFFYD